MKLELRDYHSADVDEVWTWSPNSLDEVFFQLTIDIGEQDEEGAYSFQLVVATPEGIRQAVSQYSESIIFDRAMLILPDYSWKSLKNKLESIIEVCSRENWDKSINCLQRYFQWEYEDQITDGENNRVIE